VWPLLEILADEFVYAWALAMLLGVKQLEVRSRAVFRTA
jgi:hypothetical protein